MPSETSLYTAYSPVLRKREIMWRKACKWHRNRQAPVVGTFRRAGPAAAVLSKVADLTQHTAAFLQAFCGLLLVSLIIGPLVFHWCSLKLAIPLNWHTLCNTLVHNWNQTLAQLSIIFGDRLKLSLWHPESACRRSLIPKWWFLQNKSTTQNHHFLMSYYLVLTHFM